MAQQLPLRFGFNPRQSFEQFWSGGNGELLAHLRRFAQGDEVFLYLWGGRGLGKSHLLQATCQEAHQQGRSISFLPMDYLQSYGPELFEDLDGRDLVCIDDLDRVLGQIHWERALFSLYNRLRERPSGLLVSASRPPGELGCALPDLRSRLSFGPVYRLQALDDEGRLGMMALYAGELGLELPPAVGRFLLAHCRRDLPALRALLERLDRATLAAQRRLTIPFIKRFLEEPV